MSKENSTVVDTQVLRGELARFEGKLKEVLPAIHRKNAKRFIERLVITFYTSEDKVYDKLEKCEPRSFGLAMLEAAERGFAIDGKFVFLIPYGDQAQAEFSWEAIVAQARRSGVVEDIRPQVVHEKDEFDYWDEGGRQQYKFRPAKGDRGKMIGCYAVALFPSGYCRFTYMDAVELAKVQRASKAPNSPAWKNWKDQMWCKAVIKRLSKGLLDDPGFTQIVELDNRNFDLDQLDDKPAVKTIDSLADEIQEDAQRLTHQPEMEPIVVEAEASEPVVVDAPRKAEAETSLTREQIEYERHLAAERQASKKG